MNQALLAGARAELGRLPAILDALLAGLDVEGARVRPAPGEWSPVEIICHLRDEEVEDFGARLQVIVSGAGDFTRIDPERWAEERRYREASLRTELDALRLRRHATLDLLASLSPDALNGSPKQWSRLPLPCCKPTLKLTSWIRGLPVPANGSSIPVQAGS